MKKFICSLTSIVFLLFPFILRSQCQLLNDEVMSGVNIGKFSSYVFNSSSQLVKIEITDPGFLVPNRMDTIFYDSSGNFTKMEHWTIGAAQADSVLIYSRDTSGNISRIKTTTSNGDSWAYDMSYDSSNQLISIILDSSSIVGNIQADLNFLNLKWSSGNLSQADLVVDFGFFIDTLEVSLTFDNMLNFSRMIPPAPDELPFYLSNNNFLTVTLDENEVAAPKGTIILSQSYHYNAFSEVDTLWIDSTISNPQATQIAIKYNCVVGIEKVQTQSGTFTVSPNPAKDFIQLSQLSDRAILLGIYSLNGKLIELKQLPAQKEYELDVSDLTSGIYFLQLTTEDGRETIKILIQ